MHIPFLSRWMVKQEKARCVPTPPPCPPLPKLTMAECLELEIIQERIANEERFGENNRKYFDDYIEAKQALADDAGSMGQRLCQLEHLNDIRSKLDLRRLSNGNHLTRLLGHRIEFENIRKGREFNV